MGDGKLCISKKTLLITIVLMIVFGILFLAASVIYTERPIFCNSCHLMEPYYKGWKHSSHNGVNCLKCHYEPGLKHEVRGKIDGLVQVIDYITGRYSEKPVATVSDNACLRPGCHVKEKIKDKVINFKDKVGFKHAVHWGHFDDLGQGVELRCATCHQWQTFDKHMAVDENACFICHFKSVSVEKITHQCLGCHTGIPNNGEHKEYMQDGAVCMDCHTTIKTSDAPVMKQMCYFCHGDPVKLAQADNRILMHQKHIPGNKADCVQCHEMIGHGKE